MTSKLQCAIRQAMNYVMGFEAGGGVGCGTLVHCLIKVSNHFNCELLRRVLFSIATSQCSNAIFHKNNKGGINT